MGGGEGGEGEGGGLLGLLHGYLIFIRNINHTFGSYDVLALRNAAIAL